MMDLDSFLVSLYVLVVEGWKVFHPSTAPRKPGRPALLCESEVLTLAILAQWPRFRSERDFWCFARAHLRPYFPSLCSQSQLNRRIQALELELRLLQLAFAEDLTEPSAVYPVMDTTLVRAMVMVRSYPYQRYPCSVSISARSLSPGRTYRRSRCRTHVHRASCRRRNPL